MLAALLGVVLLGAATVMIPFAQGQQAMQDSPHNMAGRSGGGEAPPTGDTAVCMACHIPGGDPSDAMQPLWQQEGELPENGYTTFDTLGLIGRLSGDGGGGGGDTGSVSMACLSCHDGSQARAVQGLQGGGMAPRGSPSSHPVGIEYARGRFSDPGRRKKARDGGGIFASSRPQAADFHPPQRAVINEQVIWWLGDDSVRDKEDVQLYTRTGQDGQAIPYIECASCHDPHSLRVNLLRKSNAGSAVCLSCHDY